MSLIASPLAIPGCTLWLDASDSAITKDGSDNVSQWNDLSGNARHATNGGGATRPVYIASSIQGKPAIRFLQASDSFLDLPAGVAPSGDAAHTAFMVAKRIAGAGTGARAWLRLATTTSVRTNSVIGANHTTGASYFGTAAVGTPLGDILVIDKPAVLTKRYRVSTQAPTNLEGWTNRTGRVVESSQMTLGDTAGWLGCSVATASADFAVAAVVVYNRALTDGEIAQVELYLQTKYGLPIRQLASPTELPGCALWLDAADIASITKDGSNKVSQWNDKSGNAKHAVQATGANQPTYNATGYNGLPCLDWGSSPPAAMGLITPAISYGTFTAFFVIDGVAGGGYIMAHRLDGANQDYVYRQTASYYTARASAASSKNVASSSGGATWLVGKKVLVRRFDGTNAGNIARANVRILDAPSLGGGASDPGVAAVSGAVGIGNYTDSSEAFRGKIAEAILFDRALTDGETVLVESYLSKKWKVYARRSIASPLEILDCVAWYDAAQGVTLDGSSNVSQWNDQSGNANHVTQSDATRRPSVVASWQAGRPAIRFDGSNDILSKVVTVNQPATVICAYRIRTNVVNQDAIWALSTSVWIIADATPRTILSGGSNLSHPREIAFASADIVTAVLNGNDSSMRSTLEGTVARGAGGALGGTSITIGGFPNNTHQHAVDVGELIVFSRALSEGEIRLIERYLETKYAL